MCACVCACRLRAGGGPVGARSSHLHPPVRLPAVPLAAAAPVGALPPDSTRRVRLHQPLLGPHFAQYAIALSFWLSSSSCIASICVIVDYLITWHNVVNKPQTWSLLKAQVFEQQLSEKWSCLIVFTILWIFEWMNRLVLYLNCSHEYLNKFSIILNNCKVFSSHYKMKFRTTEDEKIAVNWFDAR